MKNARRVPLVALATVLLVAGCTAAPTTSATAPAASKATATKPAAGATAPKAAAAKPTVTVVPTALAAIADPAKQAAGAAITTALALQLDAEREMDAAEALLGLDAAPARYELADAEEEADADAEAEAPDAAAPPRPEGPGGRSAPRGERPEGDRPLPLAGGHVALGPGGLPAGTGPKPENPGRAWWKAEGDATFAGRPGQAQGGVIHAHAHALAAEDADAARTAWKGLAPEARDQALAARGERMKARHGMVPPGRMKRLEKLAPTGDEVTEATADGGKAVTRTYELPGDEPRTLTITRTFDAEGQLLQVTQKLTGTRDGQPIDCERTRTFQPDGSTTVTTDAEVTIDGKKHGVRWGKRVGADGGCHGVGVIAKPDGTEVALVSEGTEGGAETISGADEAAGVEVTIAADAAADETTATVAADGASATVELAAEAG